MCMEVGEPDDGFDDVNTIQTSLNNLIKNLKLFDCSQLDEVLCRVKAEKIQAPRAETLPDSTLQPEHYVIRYINPIYQREVEISNHEIPLRCYDSRKNSKEFCSSHGQIGDDVYLHSDENIESALNYLHFSDNTKHDYRRCETRDGNDGDDDYGSLMFHGSRRSSLNSSKGSLKKMVIEGDMVKEEEVMNDLCEESSGFKVTQTVKMTRHIQPITEIIEFLSDGGDDDDNLIHVVHKQSRRVIEVDVEEELHISPSVAGTPSCYMENMKTSLTKERPKMFVHSRHDSQTDETSGDVSRGNQMRNSVIETEVEVVAEVLADGCFVSKRIVRTKQIYRSPSVDRNENNV